MSEYYCLCCAGWGFGLEVEGQADSGAASAVVSSETAPAALPDESGDVVDKTPVSDGGPSTKGQSGV